MSPQPHMPSPRDRWVKEEGHRWDLRTIVGECLCCGSKWKTPPRPEDGEPIRTISLVTHSEWHWSDCPCSEVMAPECILDKITRGTPMPGGRPPR